MRGIKQQHHAQRPEPRGCSWHFFGHQMPVTALRKKKRAGDEGERRTKRRVGERGEHRCSNHVT